MNKKMLLGLVATTAMGAGAAVISTTTAQAADTSTNMTTKGSISFFDTNKPGQGPFENNLALAYVPNQFDFGNHDITGVTNAVTYKQEIAAEKTQYLAVSDDRESKLKGWKVTASVSDFTSNTSTSATPDNLNAELSFKLGENLNYAMDPAKSDETGIPTPAITEAGVLSALGETEAAYYGIEAGKFITLTAGGAEKEVLNYGAQTQEPGKYLGVAREISSVQLKVKDHTNVQDKLYKGTVNWVLAEDV